MLVRLLTITFCLSLAVLFFSLALTKLLKKQKQKTYAIQKNSEAINILKSKLDSMLDFNYTDIVETSLKIHILKENLAKVKNLNSSIVCKNEQIE